MGVTTSDKGDDAADIERTVAEIKTASALVWIVLLLGPIWTIVVGVSGWGVLTWALGAAVWCLFLLRSVYVLQVLRCPRCGRPWRTVLREVADEKWPIQKRCRACGFDVDDYSAFPS
jgi:hypothetical protein